MRCVSDNYLTDLELCDSTVFTLMQKREKKQNYKIRKRKKRAFMSLFTDTEF